MDSSLQLSATTLSFFYFVLMIQQFNDTMVRVSISVFPPTLLNCLIYNSNLLTFINSYKCFYILQMGVTSLDLFYNLQDINARYAFFLTITLMPFKFKIQNGSYENMLPFPSTRPATPLLRTCFWPCTMLLHQFGHCKKNP
jgi:hypothetical protein